MLPRFYAPDLERDRPRLTLSPDEARHLTRVLRLGPGEEIAVFDGRGLEYRAVVETVARDVVTVRTVEPIPPPGSLPVQFVVAQAVLKGGSMDDAIRDATMMGATAIAPLLTEHCDVKAAVVMRPEALERWKRVALASVKQSRRATLPEIDHPRSVTDWLAGQSDGLKLLFVEPSANCAPVPLRSLLDRPVPPAVTIVLGPEGGWASSEVDLALRAGCVAVTLGPLTLRAESMPVAAMAAVMAILA